MMTKVMIIMRHNRLSRVLAAVSSLLKPPSGMRLLQFSAAIAARSKNTNLGFGWGSLKKGVSARLLMIRKVQQNDSGTNKQVATVLSSADVAIC